ncbi:MAG: pyruvate, phosphate dikinase [Leptospirales bacterium]|nr:pyruvate, phosphate dikinase [Leptospirales bacterium]
MQLVYSFGAGNEAPRDLGKMELGGKGINLAEMSRLGIPVPPGLTVMTEACRNYMRDKRMPPELMQQVRKALAEVEKSVGKVLGDPKNPLLLSVRSGAPVSMPGMMDTILNLGLNESTLQGLIQSTGAERFAWDSYRRFIQMFGDVVLGVDHDEFEKLLDGIKAERGATLDTELDAGALRELIGRYRQLVREKTERDFPDDVNLQLELSIEAVFRSWGNDRAVFYRRMNRIPDELGTAVTVQCMVFGNMGDDSGTGVAFTRDPSTGEHKFYGEYLMNAQGEDVVAGIRTPHPIAHLDRDMPAAYRQLTEIQARLEKHFGDMQDLEFTIEREKLYLLQTRSGKRTGFAALRIAVDMVKEGVIDEKTAVMRVAPESLPALLAPVFHADEKAEAIRGGRLLARGLNAGPGAASAPAIFDPHLARERADRGEHSILVRTETSPEDIMGMECSEGILTARGGMTSHAAVVARGMNKPCVVGCQALRIDSERNMLIIKREDGSTAEIPEGQPISIDGATGEVISGSLSTTESEIDQYLQGKMTRRTRLVEEFELVMQWADRFRRLDVRANAETPRDAKAAMLYGARGIGLCRTEHMFFGEDRITAMREMIMAENLADREKALAKLLPFQRADFIELFETMSGFPVTVRLLDPPLHEFLPHSREQDEELAAHIGVSADHIKRRSRALAESNPMLGHRGCRLGITYPEITRMQARAIFEAAAEMKKRGHEVTPEIMVPLVGHARELELQREVIDSIAAEVTRESGVEFHYLVGTMIEVPRAAVQAEKVARSADFFSFGTNDLTQMTLAFSRDDSGSFIRDYLAARIYEANPFESLDKEGVGEMIRIAVERGRRARPGLKLGVCGEHGGDPESIAFFHDVGLQYVSCSPFRIPVARLAAAQAAIRSESTARAGAT